MSKPGQNPQPKPPGPGAGSAFTFYFDFIAKRNIAFAVSGGMVLLFWIWVIASGGLKYGIDFTGGIRHVFKFNRPATVELLSKVREASLIADPGAQVQNLGKPEEGEVMIQVKGFETVEKAARAVERAPVMGVEDLKARLADFEMFDAGFYEKFRADTGLLDSARLKKIISDYVNESTARRLQVELGRKFGGAEDRIDLNAFPVAARLFQTVQRLAVGRLAASILDRLPTARTTEDLTPLLKDADLDPNPFEEKYILRAPTLEEIKTDLHDFAGRPEPLSEELLKMYPAAYREAFMPSLERIVAGKETRGLYDSVDAATRQVDGPQAGRLRVILAASFHTGPFVLIKTDQVSSRIGAELRQKALAVISISLLVMLLYIWFRFELRFGVGAIVTLLHDSLTVIPLMSALGYEYDINLIAAILTIIGYSLNDTIVVYDRIRENMTAMRGSPLDAVINTSIVQTLSRTLVTGVTSLLAILALFFFGGPVLEGFSLALFIGILVGTYSSIFVSAPVVYLWPVKK